MGKKESLPSRTYNITVNHRRQILYTTRGHPARWNDKTLALFDELIMNVKNGKILSDYEFSLFENDEEENIQQQQYNGCWILCDNGYQNWSVLMAPMKDATTYKEIRWSKWVESVRKDVECTFGIMKGRFRILKIGIRLQTIEAVDKLWCTCCALHNMLLEDDGLSQQWNTGARSDWEGELGQHSSDNNMDPNYDASGMGFGNDYIIDDYDDDDQLDNNTINNNNDDQHIKLVCDMPCFEFREKLINHFDILFQQNKIKWPTRNGIIEPSI
jgi:hypothetical protein